GWCEAAPGELTLTRWVILPSMNSFRRTNLEHRGQLQHILARAPNVTQTRDKVILAYSGGLDTSVMVKWIGEKYNLDVVTFTVDLGQGEDIEKIRTKALKRG